MTELKTFSSSEFGEVRIAEVDNEPWFCLLDVCRILGIANHKDVKNRLSEKGVDTIDTLTKGGKQSLLYVNESNLYKTIFQSKKAEAEKFTDWVTGEVIPSIRKNGGYIAGQESASPEMILAKAMIVAQNVIKANEQKIAELQPKADYFDNLVDRNLLLNFTDTAKELGIKRKDFIDWLLNNKYCFRSKKNDIKPYAAYSNTATENTKYFEVKEWANDTHSGIQTLITPRGREVFRLLMIG